MDLSPRESADATAIMDHFVAYASMVDMNQIKEFRPGTGTILVTSRTPGRCRTHRNTAPERS
jgi:hypothetical protein